MAMWFFQRKTSQNWPRKKKLLALKLVLMFLQPRVKTLTKVETNRWLSLSMPVFTLLVNIATSLKHTLVNNLGWTVLHLAKMMLMLLPPSAQMVPILSSTLTYSVGSALQAATLLSSGLAGLMEMVSLKAAQQLKYRPQFSRPLSLNRKRRKRRRKQPNLLRRKRKKQHLLLKRLGMSLPTVICV